MTAKELCAKVGITEANLSILRSGKASGVRFHTINRICYYLAMRRGRYPALRRTIGGRPLRRGNWISGGLALILIFSLAGCSLAQPERPASGWMSS